MAAIQRTTKQQIFDAVHDLYNKEQPATREALQAVTGLTLTIIDDRLATLADDGYLERPIRGVYVPVIKHPPARPISKSILPGGMVKIEIGDEVLSLTPCEDRTLASLQAGVAVEFAAIEIGRGTSALVAVMRQQITRMQARLRRLEGLDQKATSCEPDE